MSLVFVFFSVPELPLPLVMAAMGMGLLPFWKHRNFTDTFECPLSRLEPGFLREASERRRNGLFSKIFRRGEGIGAWELGAEMGTISPKVPEFHFASMMMTMVMASSASVPEPPTSSSSVEIEINPAFSRAENGISFSRVENVITFSFSHAGKQAEPVGGFCGDLILIPWRAHQFRNVHHHLILLLAR